jgi:hypothetical protein
MAKTANARRVARHRDKLRAQGMRLVQIWVPDIRHPDFAAEARRQGALLSATYADDADVQWWLDNAEAELAAFYRNEP